ncbi:MAG TPA: glycoside hydrolase family 2 TIM barrel-domain containing protein, partial [Opitutaceae bacterium]
NEAEDLAILLDSGANAVRTSHYQDSQSWYDRCDRAGLAVWTEIPNWQLGSTAPLYLENGKQQLRELIRQNYNHPSIFFWGVGNETYGPAADGLAEAFAKVAKSEDPSRLSTYAQNQSASDPKAWYTDVVGFNRYFGWYADTLAAFAPWLDQTRAQHPKARFGMSEYGAGASVSQHEEDVKPPAPRGHWHPEEYQNLYHETYAAALRGRPYVWGTFIWCLFDFASDGRDEGDHAGRNDKGLVTYDRRTKKDAYFLYKAAWTQAPVLHITSAGFTDRTAAATEIKVYSNAREVTVALNGVSLGAKADADGSHVFRWPGATLAVGENRVTATAVFPGGAATDACVWTLRASSATR